MGEDEVAAAIKAVIAETGAASIKDMGKVIAELKARYAGKMDFARSAASLRRHWRDNFNGPAGDAV